MSPHTEDEVGSRTDGSFPARRTRPFRGDGVPADREPSHPLAVAAVIFSILGGLVVLPWAHRGTLLLLDWARGPKATLPRSVWGLDGGVTAAAPFHVAVRLIDHVIGVSTTDWLVILIVFPIGGIGMSRLVAGSLTARTVAGLAYVLSPMVYERVWAGQVAFLIAYAALPWAVASAFACVERPWPANLAVAGWIAALIGLAPHFAILMAIVIVAVVVAHGDRPRMVAWGAAVLGLALAASFYLVVGSNGREGGVSVGHSDLHVFQTTADRTVGLYLNVLAQYGFWRREPPLPKDDVAGWPFLLAALLIVAGVGAVAAWRSSSRRRQGVALALSGAGGYVIALGQHGPFGSLFVWAFDHVPGFAIMREPQKGVALLALATAAFVGWGTDSLRAMQRETSRRVAVSLAAVVLPLAYNPSLFLGLRHRLAPSSIPRSWGDADQLMGRGDGAVLALPWHQYVAFDFTGRRVVANPMSSVFSRTVIAGDNVEVGGIASASTIQRSKYLEYLYSRGPEISSFGELVAPLGVEFIALAKTVDWQSYRWLDHQRALEVVLDRPEMRIYRNRAAEPGGYARAVSARLPDWAAVVAEAEQDGLRTQAVTVASPQPQREEGSPVVPEIATEASNPPIRTIRHVSPTKYLIDGGPAAKVVIPDPFDSSWAARGAPLMEHASGAITVDAPPGPTTVEFAFWRRLRAAYVVSAVVFVLICGSSTVANCRYRWAVNGRQKT